MSRDAARLTRALERNAGDMLAYLERRVGVDDAPDLLGETMVVAWRRVDDLPDDAERARMWLFGIARGTLLNHARGTRRRWALADRIRLRSPEDLSAPAADAGAEVRDAIARLAPDEAEIVRLVHWDGFSIADAAELIGIPASTARGRYQRAKSDLRVALSVEAPLA
ncbi:RNA polymerase sigma factor [Microbacterium saperdae]|uniref:RNA polymerase sigma-70 factor (ECF subfamily) n=1 Tax=Microbacterium saperdae TaxID=69368 RepID=A0A543BN91_9MICO|nr:RNA polymerase sigma factor [Microbacterium saperdae]TQL86310.1 RNA polymerase sigma-70 factor (ECF subfamily) [Microbacterium saperdae]GGM48937.1 DNA-directed RNA polymerase sigma-70 factor [Microbacterium saperdae]